MENELKIALVSSILALIGTIIGLAFQYWKSRKEFHYDVGKVKADYMAESVVRRLLSSEIVPYRTFRIIRHHIGG